jgi:small conductance mechanosensitive channel
VVVLVIGSIMVLAEFGVNLGPILASAGIVGVAVGFGAQNLVRDFLSGMFMLLEDQYGVGDIVDVGEASGVVEAVGLRITTLRDVNGTVWYVRNGEILRVGNMSHGWARVIIDLAVPYEADVEAVQEKMLETATALATDPKWRSRIIEKPEIWGLESISAEALIIRLVIKTRTNVKDDVARELRIRLKSALDDMGIKLPALNSIVLSGFEGAASVKGARPPRTRPVAVAEEPTSKQPRTRGSKTAADPRAVPVVRASPTSAKTPPATTAKPTTKPVTKPQAKPED